MINSLGGEQDNVVFMGRRSFRMEIAGEPHGDDPGIPMRASGVPTEKLFETDRDREGWTARAAAAAALQSARLTSRHASVVALCVATFVLGIALTLTFNGRAAPRRAPVAAAVEPRQVAAPATVAQPTMIIQPMPVAAPTDAEVRAGLAFAPPLRPLAKPARAARPRPARAARPTSSAETSAEEPASADPFAAPAPTTKPAAKPWVDPFAE